MDIQWFPGHMQETEQLLRKAVLSTDVILEVLDARLPRSSSNPLLDDILKSRKRVRILNKEDLADPVITRLWIDYFNAREPGSAMALNALEKNSVWRAVQACLRLSSTPKSRRTRLMVVGIPNTGKSTLMNSLAGKKIARTGNTPAITRHQQRATLRNGIDLYDTPGILWPVLDDPDSAIRLAASGAISDVALDYSDVACPVAGYLLGAYPDLLRSRYPLPEPYPAEPVAFIEAMAILRGCLRKGGLPDFNKASELLIRELRTGRLGRISLETPEHINRLDG